MGCLTPTVCFVFTVLLGTVSAIRVPSQPLKNVTNAAIKFDRDRPRRLIPYMTFYVPSNTAEDYKYPSGQGDLELPPQKTRQMNANHQSPPPPLPSAAPPAPSVQLKPIVYFAKFQPQMQQQQQQQQHYRPPSAPSSLLVYDGTGSSSKDYLHHPPPPPPLLAPPQNYYQPANNPKALNFRNAFPSLQNQQQSNGVITQSYYQAQPLQRPPKRPAGFIPFLPSNRLPGKFVPMQQSSLFYDPAEDEQQHNNNLLIIVNRNPNQQETNSLALPKKPIFVEKPVFVTSTVKPENAELPAAKLYYSSTPNYLGEDIPSSSPRYEPNLIAYDEKPTKSYYAEQPAKAQYVQQPEKNVKIHFYTPVVYTTPSYTSTTPKTILYPVNQVDEDDEVVIEKPSSPYQGPKYLPTTPAPEKPYQGPRYLPTPSPSYPTSSTTPSVSTFHPTLSYYMPKNTLSVKPLEKEKVATPRPFVTAAYEAAKSNGLDLNSASLADLLRQLQESNHLPETLTPDNIDNSIKTLVKILNNMKAANKENYKPTPKPYVEEHTDSPDYDYKYYDDLDSSKNLPPGGKPGPNSGRPGVDYPIYSEIPQTSFSCRDQRYKGFFGDPETNCQVWHYCDLSNGKNSFLCPNGTIFSQVALTCDWWFNVNCANTAQQYVLNERLYKYILPFTPKFPEDYSGPLVDKYLAMKFEEMEEKMRRQKEKGAHKEENEEESENNVTAVDVVTTLGPQQAPEEEESTQAPHTVPSPPSKTIVESERVRLIEIKTDGVSGHLSRNPDFSS